MLFDLIAQYVVDLKNNYVEIIGVYGRCLDIAITPMRILLA